MHVIENDDVDKAGTYLDGHFRTRACIRHFHDVSDAGVLLALEKVVKVQAVALGKVGDVIHAREDVLLRPGKDVVALTARQRVGATAAAQVVVSKTADENVGFLVALDRSR